MRTTSTRRGLAIGATALLTTSLAAIAPASAQDALPTPFPAVGQHTCETTYGGVYDIVQEERDDQFFTTQTCIVDGEVAEQRPGANPNNGFRVDVVGTSSTVYTNAVRSERVNTGDRCFNELGWVMTIRAWNADNPLSGNPNCVAAYRQGGQQLERPGYSIRWYAGDWAQREVVRTADVTEDLTVTACYNRGGNTVNGWRNNPNCQVR
ncbi:MAG: hypothetical protein Q4G40_12720 [Brachybacterium sp.]|nr:hypothetical protein [Brachybacterium sp.]